MAARRHKPKPVPVGQAEFGLAKLGASRFDFRDPYHLAVSLSWPGFVLAVLAAWMVLNFGFAALYAASPGCIANAKPGAFADLFFFSIETLATVGYGVMAPATLYGHIVSALETMAGLAFTAIVTGSLFVRFSRPKAKIVYAAEAVVAKHHGRPTLMIRLANGRTTMMSGANARLFVLLADRTEEGRFFRRIHELPLVQSHLPLFVMPWTLMHVIGPHSPLEGHDAASLTGEQARLFLTIEAWDHVLSATVFDLKSYPAEQIRFGMRFADSVSLDDTGRVTADLARISLLVPE
ncbi:MAG TPA: ion channel [Rhodopila sp.]|nr:ion channel [Rhodopila sp.]